MTRLRPPAALRAVVGIATALLLLPGPLRAAADRHPATGMVVRVDAGRQTFVASIETIPGVMAAMTMPFPVPNARDLDGLVPGAVVDFTFVVDGTRSWAEGIHIRRYETVEQDPLAARRLGLFRELASGRTPVRVAIGETVPDFSLVDQTARPVTLRQFRGQVVAINFMYTTCQLTDYCLRLVNHFGVLQKRFAADLGRNLIFLTVTFDPVRDTPDVLDRYSRQWNARPSSWHFLTGPQGDIQKVLEAFGVSAVPDEGLMDHSLHAAVVTRDGRLAANVEGNQYSTDQLGDLIAEVLRVPAH